MKSSSAGLAGLLLIGQLAACGQSPLEPGDDAGAADAPVAAFDGNPLRDRFRTDDVPEAPPFVSCFGPAPMFEAPAAGMAFATRQSHGDIEVRSAALTPTPPSVWGDPKAIPPSQLAARLSRFLWRSEPDAELLQKVAACPNIQNEDLAVLVRQMLADDRAVAGLEAFFNWWLKLDRIATLWLDRTLFPELTPALRQSLADEPRRFGVDIIRHGAGSLRSLLTAPFTFMDGNLAVLYGVADIPGSAPLQRVMFSPSAPRAGLLTQPGVLATPGWPDRNSPAKRAIDLLDRILCSSVPPPPSDTIVHYHPDAVEPRPGQTLRQAIESAIQAPVCAACHSLLEIGFVFEPYDPLGRARATDNGVAIDATSRKFFEFSPLSGALDLGAKASESPAVAKCFARKWLTFALGREPRESEHDRYVDALAVDFSNRDLDIRALIAAVTQTVLFLAP